MPSGSNLDKPIAEIAELEAHARTATPAVRQLTPNDLDDLAARMRGARVANPKVNALTFKDVESLEAVFQAQRGAALASLRPGGTAADVCCCSCCPCCCCT